MKQPERLTFRLEGSTFHEIAPDILISNLNALAFVSRIQKEKPHRIEIAFDGGEAAMGLLTALASEVGYFARIEGTVAVYERA